MRRWLFVLSAFVGVAGSVAACGGSDCDAGQCSGPAVSPEGGDGGEVQPPFGCDTKADPKDAPACVVNEYGVFVSPTGRMDAPGTKEAPVNSIMTAIAVRAGKPRIYICEGSYEERIELKTTVSLYGGFACADWKHTGAKATVGTSQDVGYALDVVNVAGSYEIADLEFVAANGTEASPNSIAARFVRTSGAVLRRVKLTARNAFDGKAGVTGAPGSTVKHTDFTGTINPYSPDGNPGMPSTNGVAKTCRCPNTGSAEFTMGGGGGSALTGAGQEGQPVIPPTNANDGVGGAASAPNCGLGDGTGHNGADRAQAAGGHSASVGGALDLDSWKTASGGDGSNGLPGQGGGGGSGQSAGSGSGGACGGCGGYGGKGGAGGGASIALLAIDSPIRIAGELATAKGGRGGDGGDGGDGGIGGTGGRFSGGNGCNGGDGGKGGKGGDGAGGAGGLSIGIVYAGAIPFTDGSTFTLGTPGDGGTGKQNNSGAPGVKAEIKSVEAPSSDGGS